jgi:hypothetical protein
MQERFNELLSQYTVHVYVFRIPFGVCHEMARRTIYCEGERKMNENYV